METSSLYWLQHTLTALPAFLWIYCGLGIIWALVILPRRHWRDLGMVMALAFALGPALLTGWMFILGVLGASQNTALLTNTNILIGTLVTGVIGLLLFIWIFRRTEAVSRSSIPFATDEKILIGLIIIAVILRWLVTSFWTFTAYDPIWVYGFEGRLYTLTRFIPNDIGYYPQFLPLQYTFGQLFYGGINDYAARAVIPLLHIGSIFAAYVLGKGLFNRRTGILLAAIWALYPHVGDWAHVGDLEIPLTFLITTTSAFFLMAWTAKPDEPRRRYALIAGLVLGIAMWTKPTAGALIWGVVLLVAVDLLVKRFNFRAWWVRFETAAIAGIACIPLGGAWYIRNVLLGHNAIDLPPEFWLSQARRSGDFFGFVLLALFVLLAFLYFGQREKPDWRGGLIGTALILLGIIPTLPFVNPTPDPIESRMSLLHWASILLGSAILAYTLYRYARPRWTPFLQNIVSKIGWTYLLALPYFFTFYISYSYHFRLLFPIVPLLILPTAVILAYWITPQKIQSWQRPVRFLYFMGLIVICIPGVVSTLFDTQGKIGWLWSDELQTDEQKYRVQNDSLMSVVEALESYRQETGEDPVVIAPGTEQLNFFFPLLDIDNKSTPTTLDDLDGATHFIYGTRAQLHYDSAGIDPANNPLVNALGREDVMTQLVKHDNGSFLFELYELHTGDRLLDPEDGPILHLLDDEIVFGDTIQYLGDNVSTNNFHGKSRVFVSFLFQVLQPIDDDYILYVHLFNEDDEEIYATWDGPVAPGDHGYYSTRFWEPGETIIDSRVLSLSETEGIPHGNHYKIVIGFYRLSDGQRLPVTINGETVGDGMPMVATFNVYIPED